MSAVARLPPTSPSTASEIRLHWTHLIRYLGRSRDMWAWLLGLPRPVWPPPEAGRLQRAAIP